MFVVIYTLCFQVLKLSENLEPVCSNVILAKVRNAGDDGSGKIVLQIIGKYVVDN